MPIYRMVFRHRRRRPKALYRQLAAPDELSARHNNVT
jgi:hypothetical protein